MHLQKHLIVVGGPTAGGKTELSIRLARHYQTVIVSCDSRQFYREMSIGTAKPTREELARAPHYFIDSLSIGQPYSVGDYEREALTLLEQLFQTHDVVILTGGSGLFIKAVCEGLDDFPEVPLSVRREVENWYQNKGLVYLQQKLQEADPEYYEEVDRQNPHRLIRALAVWRASGQPFSSFRKAGSQPRSFTPIYLQTHWPRDILYQRINQRVEKMMSAGLLEEARRLHPRRGLTALETVGYQELFDYFEGKTSLPEAIALIQRNSRRYAKRQLTWLRRDGRWKHVHPTDEEIAIEYLELCRQHDLRLLHVPPLSLPPSLAEQDTPPKASFLVFTDPGNNALVLPRRDTKDYTLLFPPLVYGKPLPSPALPLLLHETQQLTEPPLYALFPAETEPFYQKAGFKTIAIETLPFAVPSVNRLSLGQETQLLAGRYDPAQEV